MTVESKKYRLIEKITGLQDESILDKLALVFEEYSQGSLMLQTIIKPIRQKLDIEELKQEQNYQGFDQEEVDRLIEDIDLQEPLEELLDMI